MAHFAAIIAQELAIGLPWTLVHCPAMCGPLLVGLRPAAGPGTAGANPAGPAAAAIGIGAGTHLFFYQLGRSGPYLAAGALAGAGGEFIGRWRQGGAVLAALVATAFLVAALRQVFPRLGGRFAALPGPGARRLAALLRACAGRPRLAAAAAGLLLSGLPCGVAAWALALAGATASPGQGMGVMAVLLAMNSLPLAGAVLAPAAWRRMGLRTPRWLVPACLLVSSATTIALAIGAARAGAACPLCLGHG